MTKKKDEPIKINGAQMASELLAGLDPTMRNRILGEIRQKDPGLADKLKKGMISFDRVIALEAADLQKVLRACPQNLIALSLRGLDESSKKTVFSKMTERQAGAHQPGIQANIRGFSSPFPASPASNPPKRNA